MSESSEEYVTVAEFIEPVYAQMAKGALESAGIECFLQGEHTNNLQMGAVFASALQVHRQDEEAAREILDEVENTPAVGLEGLDDEDDGD
jgi:hypothetical protein